MGLDSRWGSAVAIGTGGSSLAGRDAVRLLADWGWPIVIAPFGLTSAIPGTGTADEPCSIDGGSNSSQ
jgi:hypothetical protein